MKYTKIERERLRSLVSDCVIFNLSEKESLEYIRMRFGKSIAQSYFYFIKKSIQSDRNTQAWLNDFCRIGFVSEHRKRLEKLQLVQKILFEMLYKEWQKGESADQNIAISIVDEISRIGKGLTSLQSGSPILAQVKALLKQRSSIITSDREGEGKGGKPDDDSMLFANLSANIQDPARKHEVIAALYRARAEESNAKNQQSDDKEDDSDTAATI